MHNEPEFKGGPVDLPGDNPRHKSPKFKTKRPFLEIIKKPFLFLVSIAVIAGVGYGGWKFYNSRKEVVSPAPASQQTPPPLAAAETDIPKAENTEIFKSTELRLEFQYPKAWKVTEAEGGLRVVSPEFSYPTAGNTEKTGFFRIYMRKGARESDGKYIGQGVAIKPSEKLNYSNPGLGQRDETLLSSFGLNTSDSFAFFLVAGNFQLNPGDTLGPNYGREPDTYIIAGGYSAADLTDDMATISVPLDYPAKSEAYSQALAIIKSIKL